MKGAASATAAGASASAAGSSPVSSALPPPLLLPRVLSKKYFYLSPIANPDLVLTLIIPGHPLYSGHMLPHTASETHLQTAASPPASGSRIAHFFGSVGNVVTNTASGALGVKNTLELNKPRLKLVPRILPTADSNPDTFALNQRWMLFKEDGCVYSAVEEKDGGTRFRLGFTKNQMIRVQSKRDEDGNSATNEDMHFGGATPGSPTGDSARGGAAASTDTNSSTHSHSGIAAGGMQSASSSSDLNAGTSNSSGKGQRISVTTAKGDTVVVPRRWEVGKVVAPDSIRDMIAIAGMYVVIEDLDTTGATGIGGFIVSAATAAKQAAQAVANAAGVGGNGTGGRDTSRLLVIKDSCCGNLDCELEKIDVGASCGFRQQRSQEEVEEEAKRVAAAHGGKAATPANGPVLALSTDSTVASRAGPNIKQIWRVESDFSMWLTTLSRAVSTEYQITRKLQKIEAERKHRREDTKDPAPHVPFKFTVDYTYQCIWSTEGTKSAAPTPFSLWRPQCANGAAFFGDLAIPSADAPAKKESLVVGAGAGGLLHRALVRPVDFRLVWSKKKGKLGNLYIWEPLPPPGVDALALGHIATAGKNEDKPSVNCGVVLVMREYLKLSGHAFTTQLWNDTNMSSGGNPGSIWKVGSHMHTFYCNPNTYSAPSGSYHVMLEPQATPEKCPLLRPLETSNAEWQPVWDDRGTLATMDVSVWRPRVSDTFVRFGDQITRGHNPPTNLGVVALDHPAFVRPSSFVLATKIYRGGRKAYVFRPEPPSSDYVSLGYVVCGSKEEQPQLDCLRCVHKEALIPLGVLKQMWIEHHNGMMSTLTMGVTTLLTISKDYPVNMLWKNRSLNTFMAVQNTHARPEQFAQGNVYRLTMTANELAHTVSVLEKHAKWVLESVFITLSTLANALISSDYKRLLMTPKQSSTLFQAVRGVFKFLRASDPSGAAAFNISPDFKAYLADFESVRLRGVEKAFKRYLYQTICADVSDHANTLENLDDLWDLVSQMSDVHNRFDEVDQWQPPVNSRFPGSGFKPLVTLLLDDTIGHEIFESFLALFPPRVGKGISAGDDDDDEDEEDEERDQVAASPIAGDATPGASGVGDHEALKRQASLEHAQLSATQLAETKAVLSKLSQMSAELDTVISVTSNSELRRRYLEYYQTYLTHTLRQEFPMKGATARSAATGRRLGMSSLLAIVRWVCHYVELVTYDLLEGDTAVAATVLGKMEELSESLMDVHDDLSKEKVLGWLSNLIKMEEKASVELRQGEGEDSNKNFFYTSGPSDLFMNINSIFDSSSVELIGRPLARVALVHVHVLTYYQQVQNTFFKQLRAVPDNTTRETVKGKTTTLDIKHAGSLDKPYAYILAQINNLKQYQQNVEEFSDAVRDRLANDDAPELVITSLEDAFSQCSEEFQTLAFGATEVLIRHVKWKMEEPLSKVFTASVWWKDEDYFQSRVIDELDGLCSIFVPNIEPNVCAMHFMRETCKALVRGYLRQCFTVLKGQISSSMPLTDVIERMRDDRVALGDYVDACSKWVGDSLQGQLERVDIVIEFLASDVDFIRLHISNVQKTFAKDSEFSVAYVLQALLNIRTDVSPEDRRTWLGPYAAELKQIAAAEDARRAAEARAAAKATQQSMLATLMNNKPAAGATVAETRSFHPSESIGTTPYGLEITLVRGTDLVIKDSTTSDPYVNIILLDNTRERIAKAQSKVIDKTLNPEWKETFKSWKPSDVAQLDCIRFEVWDKDFISKDFMGRCEMSVAEIREKQLLERKTGGRGAMNNTDFTQDFISCHFKLLPLEGKQNVGSNAVSGHIDVRIRYFKLEGSDDLDFGVETVGQTGAKRAPVEDSVGASAGAPTGHSAPSAAAAAASASVTAATIEAGGDLDIPANVRSSSVVIKEIEKAQTPLWNDITAAVRLPPSAAAVAAGKAPAPVTAPDSAVATKRAPFKRAPTMRGGLLGAKGSLPGAERRPSTSSRRASGAGATAAAAAAASEAALTGAPTPRKKKMQKPAESFNIFTLG